MSVSGYSGTPLARKLGLKAGQRAALVGAPDGFVADVLGGPPAGVWLTDRVAGPAELDFVLFFTDSREALEARFAELDAAIRADGMLWIAWPKKASRVPTDLTGDVVRTLGLAAGLVDVKVCAVDAVWSGLKFMVRTAERPARRLAEGGSAPGA